MEIACRVCGYLNPPGSAVCRYCGAGAHATPALGTPQPAAPITAELVPAPADDDFRPPAGQGWAFARFQRAYALDEARRHQPYAVVPAPRPIPMPAPIVVMPPAGAKDPGTGFVLEMLPAFFGFYGIGYIWAGDVGLGLALLVGNWLFWIVGSFFAFFFSLLTLGLGFFCVGPLFMLLYLGGPVLSGLLLQRRLKARQALAAGRYYA